MTEPDTDETPPPAPRSAGADALRTLIWGAPVVVLFWICCAWIKARAW